MGQAKRFFNCSHCGYLYENRELADKCEAWCKDHDTCNFEIVKDSVNY